MPRFDRRKNPDDRNSNQRPQCRHPVKEGKRTAPCGNPLNASGQCPTHGANIH